MGVVASDGTAGGSAAPVDVKFGSSYLKLSQLTWSTWKHRTRTAADVLDGYMDKLKQVLGGQDDGGGGSGDGSGILEVLLAVSRLLGGNQ